MLKFVVEVMEVFLKQVTDIWFESTLLELFKSGVIKYKSSRLIHVFRKIVYRFALTKRASSELLKILTGQ